MCVIRNLLLLFSPCSSFSWKKNNKKYSLCIKVIIAFSLDVCVPAYAKSASFVLLYYRFYLNMHKNEERVFIEMKMKKGFALPSGHLAENPVLIAWSIIMALLLPPSS